MTIQTNVENFIGEVNAGVLAKQIGHALSDVAESVIAHEDKGEITLKIKMAPSKNISQVELDYQLSYKAPKARKGFRSESTPGDTLMYVGRGGQLSTFPEHQGDIFKQNADS
ncbi:MULTISPECIES: hypothetical protein [Psychrobacter]|jgi:hypothetical protein|uniref:hypothetical protein n=1 Tax=Psychrobacter TaxID=497 RepID=UPI0018DFC5A3|nr:hypothetical protein [Psychrobacter aquimaris]